MIKTFGFKLFGRNSDLSLERFWDSLVANGIPDGNVVARFFQFRAAPPSARAELLVAGDSAQGQGLATDRNLAFRSAEWPAMAIPADSHVAVQHSLAVATPAFAPAPAEADPIAPGGGEPQGGATLAWGSSAQASVRTDVAGLASANFGAPQYAAVFSEAGSYVYDTRTKQLLPGGPGDYPELFDPTDVRLMLSGDYSAGAELAAGLWPAGSIELLAGNSYNFTASDDLVAAGQQLNISAATLGEGDHFLFDGSAETDGSYFFLGSQSGDVILGGAGDDRFYGLDGADLMSGGGGRDTFSYRSAGESTGAGFDTLGDFDVAADRIDLPGAVTGFGSSIEAGALSLDSFDDDLSALLGGLGAGQAVWFAPDAGDLAGTIFLVVDGNGVAGYQAGEDYVFAIGGSPLADLAGHTGFFV